MTNWKLIIGFCLAVFLTACGGETEEGTLIKGNISDAANLTVSLDKVMFRPGDGSQGSTTIDDNGNFALGFVPPLEAGLYQLRIGAQRAYIVLDEGATAMQINGTMAELGTYDFDVTGSKSTAELATTLKNMRQPGMDINKVKELIDGIENPSVAAFLAFSQLRSAGATALPIHKDILDRLPDNDPNKSVYQTFVQQLEAMAAQQRSEERIQVGMPAPDISLKDPNGKRYRLSDLKGQVVLLDFWASWCRPCRAENPNVVKVYNKYKDEGFTIYSVSLDGMDSRRTGNLSSEQLAEATEMQRKRWTDAIAQDNLTWPYHVSELKKWDSSAGRAYGVRSIPATFLIDREGNIAAVGLRGAASIERELQRVI